VIPSVFKRGRLIIMALNANRKRQGAAFKRRIGLNINRVVLSVLPMTRDVNIKYRPITCVS
jgi:hypothetical protein